MKSASRSLEDGKKLSLNRKLLLFTGLIYFVWWFAVDWLLPQSSNPFASRAFVCLLPIAFLALTYLVPATQNFVRCFYLFCVWLITFHYFYLFYLNQGDANWIVGCYITVIASTFVLFSTAELLTYSIYIIVLSVGLLILLPVLRQGVFFPGLITIVGQANFGMYSRLKTLKGLRESNTRFQMLFNSTFEGVMVHVDNRIVKVNDAIATILGYKDGSELIGRHALDIIHPDERAFVSEKMKSDNLIPYETKGYCADGQAIDVEIRGKFFEYDKKRGRLVTAQDITDRKRAERERIAALTLAESVRSRDEFISIASHELKTPLSSLLLKLQLLDRGIKSHDAKVYTPANVEEFVSFFSRQTKRLNELIESLLDVSRISRGRPILEPVRFDLVQLVHEIVSIANSTLPVPIQLTAPPTLLIWADPHRMEQVIQNLVSNSVKYGNGKPVAVRITTDSHFVILEVEDHGMGISPEFIGRIFNRFERGVSARNVSGLGLGLYITRQLVEAHHGRIAVESDVDRGSKFTVQLPLAPSL